MVPEVTLEGCEILEAEARPYTNSKGQAATARTVLYKYGGKVFKMSCEQKFDISKAESRVGKKAKLTLAMSTFGQSIEPTFRVLDVT